MQKGRGVSTQLAAPPPTELCAVCGTRHPPIGPGQPLLVPHNQDAARRVVRAHADEFEKAAPGRVTGAKLIAHLLGRRRR